MATTLHLSLSIVPNPKFHHKPHPLTNPKPFYKYPLHTSNKSAHCSYLQDPLKPTTFLTNTDLNKLQTLENFTYNQKLPTGSISIRVMKAEEIDMTVKLLSESFAESMLLLPLAGYVNLLSFLVKDYLMERRGLMPHAATLVGFYGEKEEECGVLAGTVEVSVNERGANTSPPTPIPPKNAPYICNMTVKQQLRRRGIGWHLLKASEELIAQMSSSRDVYLHCRMIDEAPFNMYSKAGYNIVKTDNILILLLLQRRKHLMRKKLPLLERSLEMDISGSDEECSC